MRFKKRSCLNDIQVPGEAPGANREAAASYKEDPAQTTGGRGSSEQQTSNVECSSLRIEEYAT